jgi:hypothetical protein
MPNSGLAAWGAAPHALPVMRTIPPVTQTDPGSHGSNRVYGMA